jgi:hypothetical protein
MPFERGHIRITLVLLTRPPQFRKPLYGPWMGDVPAVEFEQSPSFRDRRTSTKLRSSVAPHPQICSGVRDAALREGRLCPDEPQAHADAFAGASRWYGAGRGGVQTVGRTPAIAAVLRNRGPGLRSPERAWFSSLLRRIIRPSLSRPAVERAFPFRASALANSSAAAASLLPGSGPSGAGQRSGDRGLGP